MSTLHEAAVDPRATQLGAPIPVHVAIIMDGNGRWASERGLSRASGHSAGLDNIRRTVRFFAGRGVKYLTLFAFSTENWGPPRRGGEYPDRPARQGGTRRDYAAARGGRSNQPPGQAGQASCLSRRGHTREHRADQAQRRDDPERGLRLRQPRRDGGSREGNCVGRPFPRRDRRAGACPLYVYGRAAGTPTL